MSGETGFYAGNMFPMSAHLVDKQGNAINLAGCSVKFRFKIGTAVAAERTATILDAPTGYVQYIWQTGELVAGNLWWEWEVIDSALRPITGPYPRRYATVIAKLA